MKEAIKEALAEIGGRWPSATVEAEEKEGGTVKVVVRNLDIGPKYDPQVTWIGFDLPTNYPDPDVYPHFMPMDVVRTEGAALGDGFGEVDWHGERVRQVSRRTGSWNGAVDTAEGKLIKVLDFVRSHP